MRNTRSWKHIRKDRKQWGTVDFDKRNTPFMGDDTDVELMEDNGNEEHV